MPLLVPVINTVAIGPILAFNLLAAPENKSTFEQVVDCLTSSGLGLDIIEYEPKSATKPCLHPRSRDRRYCRVCAGAKRDYKSAHVAPPAGRGPMLETLIPRSRRVSVTRSSLA
jgi:hypothetical protein